MKKLLFIIVLFLAGNLSAQEEFSFQLFFEDAVGNKDTLTLGYDNNATNGVDALFGEINTISQPWTGNFEIRITDKMTSILYGSPIQETFRLKKQIIQNRCGESWSYWKDIYIDVKNAIFPISIMYSDTVFQNECISGSLLGDDEENAAWDMGWYGVPFKYSDGFTQNASNLTYNDNTGDTIYSYWLKMGDSSLLTLNIPTISSVNLIIYPNPFNTQFTLPSILSINDAQLVDLSGKKIDFEQIENTFYPLNCSNGIYILSFESENKIYNFKIIKQ